MTNDKKKVYPIPALCGKKMYLCKRKRAYGIERRLMEDDKDFLRQDNNYRTLKAFQKAECIYDVTLLFLQL